MVESRGNGKRKGPEVGMSLAVQGTARRLVWLEQSKSRWEEEVGEEAGGLGHWEAFNVIPSETGWLEAVESRREMTNV